MGPVILLIILFSSYVIFAAFQSGTVTINTPIVRQNISGSFTLNVTIGSVAANTNVSNVTFFYDNGSGVVTEIGVNASPNLTEYLFVWDTTTAGVGDGINFTINATATFVNGTAVEAANYSSSIVGNVTVDNTGPTITLNAPVSGSQSNASVVTFNFTVTDNVFTTISNCNLTLDPTNSSGGAHLNSTTNVPNGTTVQFVNTVPGGGHAWNVTCVDNPGTSNVGTSAESSFGAGTTAPTVTIDLLDQNSVSQTIFAATNTVTIACTRSDDDGFNLTEVEVKIPGSSTFALVEKVVEENAINNSATLEVDFDETRELGDYVARCTVTDIVGNANQANKTFTVEKKVNSGSSAYANKNFVKPVANIKVNKGSVSTVGRLTNEGFSRLVQQSAAVKFDVEGEEHTIEVKELNDLGITLIVSSEPFEVQLKKGESKNVDIDQDGKSDIGITFHQKFGRHADLSVNLLSGEERQRDQEEREQMEKEVGKKGAKSSSAGSLTVTLIVVVIIVVIGYFLIKGKRR